MLSSKSEKIIVVILLAVIYFIAVYVRVGVASYQKSLHGFIPFTLESAFLFRYVDMAAKGEQIPETDKMAQYPEGFHPRERLTIGQEPLIGNLHRLFFKNIFPLHDFARYFMACFFCLGIFGLYLLVGELTRDAFSGIIAALFYAAALPAVIRSTGQEIMSENFALPFIIFHLWAFVRSMPAENDSSRKRSLYAAVSAVMLACAVMFWDMTQVYLYLLTGYVVLKFLFSRGYGGVARPYFACLLALVIAGSSNPYLLWHNFLFSYPMAVSYSLFLIFLLRGGRFEANMWAKFAFIVIAVISVWASISLSQYSSNYSHFARLLFYKLKFLNRKPADPALLPYDVRSIWVPALHSVSVIDAARFFMTTVLLSAVSVLLMLIELLKKRISEPSRLVLFLALAFVPLYFLFYRMEVFLILFMCALIGASAGCSKKIFPRASYAWVVVLALAFLFEADRTFAGVRAWGRDVDYPRVEDIARWTKANIPEEGVVLATFGLSPSILAYGERNIILHPKYEDPVLREKVRMYDKAVFCDSEEKFSLLCGQFGVTHYIHSKGTFSDRSINGRRYLAGVLHPSPDSNAFKFEGAPDRLTKFKKLYDNGKYIVFKVIGAKEIAEAERCVEKGNNLSGKEMYREAILEFRKAIDIYPGCYKAYVALVRAYGSSGEREKAAETAKEMFKKIGVKRIENEVR